MSYFEDHVSSPDNLLKSLQLVENFELLTQTVLKSAPGAYLITLFWSRVATILRNSTNRSSKNSPVTFNEKFDWSISRVK